MEADHDEWDPSQGTFAEHMVAGSCAGLGEHVVMYPVDTIKVRPLCGSDSAHRASGG